MEVILSLLSVAFLAHHTGASLPHERFFKSATLEELKLWSSPFPRTKSRSELLQGRQLNEDGSIELSEHILAGSFGGKPGFYHSVASGDPLPEAVIVWTRYTPVSADDSVDLEFRMAEVEMSIDANDHLSPDKNPNLKRFKVTASKETDFTVKLDVTGLKSNTAYVFAFSDGSASSDVGQTRTAPGPDDQVEKLTYAVFSCSHFTNGFFHAYDVASIVEDLDIWIHVGDYIYEYGLYYDYARLAREQRDQYLLPIWEVVDLQDYRNRYSTYLAYDEGLQNLRRRVPAMASWDDHETTNDSWGNPDQGFGAENHQPVCAANRSSSDEEKSEAKCDRDEGDARERFEVAVQAYMEYLPVRPFTGDTGNAGIGGSLTQVIEWGNLATLITFDTRISYRSAPPEVNRLEAFAFFAFQYPNYTAYDDTESAEYGALMALAGQLNAIRDDTSTSMSGDHLDLLKDVFKASKASGKPWQIWAANTMMGHNVLPDLSKFHLDVAEQAQGPVQQYFQAVLSADGAGPAGVRALTAMAAANIEFNDDDYGGFAYERQHILEFAHNESINLIVLGGDLHDSFAWKLPLSGLVEGESVAVNLGCTSVTAPGFAPVANPVVDTIQAVLGGEQAKYDTYNAAYYRGNPNLVFADVQHKGFFVAVASREEHVVEYFGIREEVVLSNYTVARAMNGGGLTANATCLASLVTASGTPGSLEKKSECSVVSFATARSPLLDIPVPVVALTGVNWPKTFTDCGSSPCQIIMAEGTVEEERAPEPTTPTGPTSNGWMRRGNGCGILGFAVPLMLAYALLASNQVV